MEEISVEMSEEDFEFAKPPLSMDFIIKTFKKYNLSFIAQFGVDPFHIEDRDGDLFIPLYEDSSYPGDIELILDFMAVERFRMLRFENGVLLRSLIGGQRAAGDEV